MTLTSLRGRLLLILLVTTVAIQVASIGGLGLLRGYETRMLRNEVIGADILHVRDQLRDMTPEQRRNGAAMRRGSYSFQVISSSHDLPASRSDDMRLIAYAMQKLTDAAVMPAAPVRVDAMEGVRIKIDAQDDLVTTFDLKLASTRPPLYGVVLYIVIVSALVLWVAWLAVGLVTRPIEGFTHAANRLARDVDVAPLSLDGPVEVQGAVQAFNAMQMEIRRQLQERSQILAAISHDLKTPLTRLKLRLTAIDSDEQRALMEADVDAMAGLIQDGLDYASSQQVRETKVPVDLNRLVQSIVDQAVDLGQECSMEGSCSRPFQAAPRALERMLQNLVDNGLRYGGRVHMVLSELTDAVEMQIHDDGPGLPPELLEKVFEPYFRADSSRSRATGGTGLGLSIARNLAQAHGGRVWLEPATVRGLIAKVWLPF